MSPRVGFTFTLPIILFSQSSLSKFPGVTDATKAFQKVSMAYNVLSQPTLRNNYDSMSQEQRKNFDFFRSEPPPEETFKSVLLGVLNEFLDGDLEVVRNFLSGCPPSPISSAEISSHYAKGQRTISIYRCGLARKVSSLF
jgi:curved DNA-binding protein CbpA